MHPTPTQKTRPDPAVQPHHVAFLIAGASGILLLFLPFAWDIKPFEDVFLEWDSIDVLWLLSAPCIVLPLPITAGYVLWLRKEALPAPVAIAAWSLSGLCVLSLVAGLGHDVGTKSADDFVFCLLFLAAIAGGAFMLARGVDRDCAVRPLLAMQVLYVIPMSFFVGGFLFDLQIGGWLGLVAVIANFLQITPAMRQPGWLLPLVIPVVGIVVFLLLVDGA